MKEENGNQDVGATAFDYPNNVAPNNYNNIQHNSQYVPKPTNSAAKMTNASKVIESFTKGK